MSDSPRPTQEKNAERAAREARLAEALRDNLRRRKEQARTRAAGRNPPDTPTGPCDRRGRGTSPTG